MCFGQNNKTQQQQQQQQKQQQKQQQQQQQNNNKATIKLHASARNWTQMDLLHQSLIRYPSATEITECISWSQAI